MTRPRPFSSPPSLVEIEMLADQVRDSLPAQLRRHADAVVLRVEEFPDEETEREMDLEDPFDLLGLYRGVDLPSQALSGPPRTPDLIFLYRRPILDYWCESGEDLAGLIRHVMIHEIGHHFGYSDEDMAYLEAQGDEGEGENAKTSQAAP